MSIARLISKNVMEYLYEMSEFEWKIDSCILDHTHGALKFDNSLRSYFIKRNIEKGAVHREKKRNHNMNMDSRYQICDVCSIRMDQFEYIYHCSAKMEDRHDICLDCIYSMIKQSEELSGLLINILRDDNYDVNDDCIEMIVSFVVGKCVKIMGNPIISMPFIKLERNILHCLPAMKGLMDDFYINKIGMEVIEEDDTKIIYGFQHNEHKQDALLELRYNDTFKSVENYSRDNAYWKIGIGAPDVDAARDSLISNRIEVSKAGQFRDI